MTRKDCYILQNLLHNHEEFGVCSVMDCEKCEEIKTFGRNSYTSNLRTDERNKTELEALSTGRPLSISSMKECLVKGYLRADIAKAYGMTESQLNNWMSKNKIRKKEIIKQRNRKIMNLVETGTNYDEISEMFSLETPSIITIIKKGNH